MRRITSIAIILIMIVGVSLVPTIIAGKIIGGGAPPGGGMVGGGTTPETDTNTSDESAEMDLGVPGADTPDEPPEEPPEEPPYVPPSGGNPSDPEDEPPEEDPQEDMEGMASSVDEDIVVPSIQSKTEGTSSKVESIALSVDEVVSGIVIKTFSPK